MQAATRSVASAGAIRVNSPPTSGSIGEFAKVNRAAQAAKMRRRQSARTRLRGCADAVGLGSRVRGGADWGGPDGLPARKSGLRAASAGSVSAAVRKNTARSLRKYPQIPIRIAPSPLPMDEKRTLRPSLRLNPAGPAIARLIAAITGPSVQLEKPCSTSA